MNRSSELPLKRRILSLLLALLVVINFTPDIGVLAAYAAEPEPPAHSKTLTANGVTDEYPDGDGTYKLSLDVTGKQVQTTSKQKTNVVVILDTSGSMKENSGKTKTKYNPTDWYYPTLYGRDSDGTYKRLYHWREGWGWFSEDHYSFNENHQPEYTGQRYYRLDANQTRLEGAQDAVNGLAETLLGKNGTGDDSDLFQLALVDFSNKANVQTFDEKQYTTDAGKFTKRVNSLTADGGTNWEDALVKANSVNFGDNDPTFVIFVSDGAPTFRNTPNGNYDINSDYYRRYNVYGTGEEDKANIDRCYETAVTPARNIVTAGKTFYTIFAYGADNGSVRLSALTEAANGDDNNFYDARDTEALQKALGQITTEISSSGVGDVTINDGTTNKVSKVEGGVSELLEVDTDSFKYYRAGGKNDNGSAKYDSSDNGGLGVEWEDAPAATFNSDTGMVQWDLKSEGLLEDGVKYTVTFDVYPSQETYDTIAKLKNGDLKYEDLDENVKKYIKKNEGSYTLYTNTEAKLGYTDTSVSGEPKDADYNVPDPVGLTSQKITINKEWLGADPDVGEEGLDLTVLCDGQKFTKVNLNENNKWTADRNISVGIIKDGNVLPGAEGHDFTFEEPKNEQFRWEFEAATVHPMLVDGTVKMLVKEDANHKALPNAETYTFKDYKNEEHTYFVSSDVNKLTATNHRRSNLNLTKVVTGDDAPDIAFPFTLTVNNTNAASGNSDNEVWFSIYDTKNKIAVTDADVKVNNESVKGELRDDGFFYYHAASGSPISVGMKAGWNLRFINLSKGTTYTFTEANTDGFSLESVVGDGTRDGLTNNFTGTISETDAKSYQVTYTNKYQLRNINVSKVWNDNNNQDGKRPDSVTINLKADGDQVATKTATKEIGWRCSFNNLPKYNENGDEIQYSITEGTVDGYTAKITGDAKTGFTVTNTHTPEKTTVSGMKTWDDNKDQDGKRPESITIKLMKTVDGKTSEVATKKVTANDGWKYSFEDLPVYKSGKKITYSIDEETVEGYTKKVDGTNVTNSYTPETTTIEGTKTWDDNKDQDGKRPESITIKLMKTVDGKTSEAATKKVTANDGWKYSFEDLPVYEFGKKITYSIDEETVEGYTTKVEGNNVTNTHIPATTSVKVSKVWKDNNNQDGKRPESITVKLLADGSEAGTAVLSDSNDWTYTFDNLAVKSAGKDIKYSVEETDTPKEYEAAISGDAATGFVITNSHTPETTHVAGTKTWDDADNQDGKRPESVKITLRKTVNGETSDVASKDVSEADGWNYDFENLPVYEGGKKIQYTIFEEATNGYTATIEGYNVTNTYAPEKTSVTVSKVWDDGDNVDAIRPNEITVKLLADGNDTGKTFTLNEDNKWTASIGDLDKMAAGKEIAYTVSEANVPDGYVPYVTGDAEKGFVITNTHIPVPRPSKETKNILVQKKWDGKTGNKAVIHLLADGKDTGKALTLTAGGNWKGSFDNLYQYDQKDGHKILYSLEEDAMDDYSVVIRETKNGYRVINTYIDPNPNPNPKKEDDNKKKTPKPPKEKDEPETGDDTNTMIPLMSLAGSSALLALVIALRRRSSYTGKH